MPEPENTADDADSPEVLAEIRDFTKNLEAAAEWARAMVVAGNEIMVRKVVVGRKYNPLTRTEEEDSYLHGTAW